MGIEGRNHWTALGKSKFSKSKEEINEKTICSLCGKETPYFAAQKCSLYWEMEQGLRMLADKDKSKAIKWLEDNLRELKGVK